MIPSNPSPSPMQASKWLQIQALVESEELNLLFREIENVKIYLVGNVTGAGEGQISQRAFLEKYATYISLLREGMIPNAADFRPFFSSILTLQEDHVTAIQLGDGKELIRVLKPVIQLQFHTIGFSSIEKKFRPKIMGKDSILWGIQFSYPQLYMDPLTKQIEKVLNENHFPNTSLFRTIQQWIRQHTVPTPFLVDDVKTNVPMRLGKKCFSWINQHPQLQAFKINVLVTSGGEE